MKKILLNDHLMRVFIMDTKGLTKEDFLKFINDFHKLGIVSERTAENIQGASMLLFDIIPDGKIASEWDIPQIIEDYSVMNNVEPNTARTYQSRFKSAVEKFIAYQNGEKSLVKAKRTRSMQKPDPKIEVEIKVKTFELPIPLRNDLIVTITNLPRDLSKAEAKRISAIVDSFAMFDDFTKE
ncbi:TPA: hypothetical protein ACPZOO_004443 [Yersinia enterocolitica]